MHVLKKSMYVFVCCVIVTLSFILPVSAADDYLYTVDDLIDMGFVYDSDEEIYTYSGKDDPFKLPFSFFMSSEKNFSDFDINTDVPWSSFPQYVKDIIYLGVDGLLAVEPDPFKLPFLLLRVSGNYVDIYAGINCAIAKSNSAQMFCFIISYGASGSNAASYISPYSCLYHSQIRRSDSSYSVNWEKLEPTDYGNKGNVQLFTPSSILRDDLVFDTYFYGANGITWSTKVQSLTIPYSSTDSNQFFSVLSPQDGFASGRFLPSQSTAYPYIFFDYFVPPSESFLFQQEQNQLIEEGNSIASDINDSLNQSGDSNFSTTLDNSSIDDYKDKEDDLLDDYNSSDLSDDISVELDSDGLAFVFDIFNRLITGNATVFTLFISIMSLGIIALILNR